VRTNAARTDRPLLRKRQAAASTRQERKGQARCARGGPSGRSVPLAPNVPNGSSALSGRARKEARSNTARVVAAVDADAANGDLAGLKGKVPGVLAP
jgi:hypothetical protein